VAGLVASQVMRFDAIGTKWVVELFEQAQDPEGLERAVHERIARFDQTFSRFRDDSLVHQMSRTAGDYALPEEGMALLRLYRRLYDATGGAVTPLIGQALEDAGYDAAYSLQPKAISPVPAWDEVLQLTENGVWLSRPALLDFGAVGKGALIDLVTEVVRGQGVAAFCINAGGDIRYVHPDNEPLPIALEHPGDPSMAIGVARLLGGSLCGSAGNRRAWAQYHHIIDPAAGTSPRHLQATWVCAADTAMADGLSTALYFAAPDQLKDFDFEYALVRADNTLDRSPGFPAEFFV
jgi:thiamine biosynthesis lipoprotein